MLIHAHKSRPDIHTSDFRTSMEILNTYSPFRVVSVEDLGLVEEGGAQRLVPGAGGRVEGAEVGTELPVAPGQPEPLGRRTDGRRPAHPGHQVGPVVRAELADEQLAIVLARPG